MAGQKPKYMVLTDWVKEQIAAGKLLPGQKLSSEHELMALFGISRQTVRHAIGILEQEGIIERKRGSGTYINNQFERSRETDTMNIAVITTYVDDYIFPAIIQEIEHILSAAGYTIQISFTHNSIEKERSVLENILQRNMIDGMIIETTRSGLPNPNLDLYEQIIARRIPTVFLNSYYPGVAIPHVALADQEAGRLITEHLIARGHKRIGAIFKADDGQGHKRYAGYVEAMIRHDIRIRDEQIVWIDTEDVGHMPAISKKILRRLRGCTACVCYNDEVASQLYEILERQHIRVPDDISLISIDNSDLAELCDVPLTSAAYPVEEMGRKVAAQLLALMKNIDINATYEFQPSLVERESVGEV